MASQAAQTKAQALNVKLEGEARAVIDDIEKNHLRKVAKQAFSCAVKCYDKAGATGPSDVLDQCVQNCQMPHRQKQQYVQNVCVRVPRWVPGWVPRTDRIPTISFSHSTVLYFLAPTGN